MMHDKAMRVFCALSLGLVFGGFAACAGTDVPPTDDLEDSIATAYANGAGVAGGSGGDGGSASTAGSGGRAPAAGNGGDGGDGGEDEPAGGAAGSGGGAAAGAGGGSTSEDPPPGDCDAVQLLIDSCGDAGCHGAGSTYSNFAESEEDLLTFVGASGVATCSSEGPLIDPDNPEQSIIVQKVDGAPPCGGAMPLTGGPLSDDEISCIVDWIGTL